MIKWILLFIVLLSVSHVRAHAQIGPYPCGANSSVTTWRNDYAYSIGQVVILNGVTYQSLTNANEDQNPCTFNGSQWTNIIGTGGGGGSIIPATPNLLKGSGVVSISVPAVPGADYLQPTGSAAGLTNFPVFNQSTTGQANTALALAATPALCPTGQAPTGILSNGNATGCAPVTTATIPATTSLLKGSGSLGVSVAAITNVDYLTPTGSAAGLTSFPTFNQNTTGNAATSTVTGAFSNTPILCSSGYAPIGILSNGNATDCQLLGGGATIPPTSLVLKGTGTAGSSQAAVPGTDFVAPSTTVNGHALSSNVIVSASDITTGTLPHAQLPTLLSSDIPNNAANTSGTASNLSGIPTLPNGTAGATQSPGDNTIKLATDAFVLANSASTPATSNLLKGNGSTNGVVAGSPGNDYVYPFAFNGMGSQGTATSSTNFGSNQFQLNGSFYDGATHQTDTFGYGSIPASGGSNPQELIVFNHFGSPGQNPTKFEQDALGIFAYPLSLSGIRSAVMDAQYFGAYGDAYAPQDGCITVATNTTVNCPDAPFLSTDVGKQLWVQGAGAAGVAYHATINTFTDASHVVMSAAPSISLGNTPGNTVYGHDDSTAVQNCFQASASSSTQCILRPQGIFPGVGNIGFLIGSAGLQLVPNNTTLSGSATNVSSSSQVHGVNLFCEFNGDCLSIAAGPIQGANVTNLELLGDPTQPNGRGIEFNAQPGTFGNGGLFNSNFTNVTVENFALECLLSEGGGGPGYAFNLPNQIDTFYQFQCDGPNQAHPANLVKMTGQHAQILFLNGQVNGEGSSNYPNPMVAIEEKTSAQGDSPNDVKFFGYTIEGGAQGLFVGEGANNIHFDNGYIENVPTVLIAGGGIGGVGGFTFNGNHLANSGNTTSVAQFEGGVTGGMRDNYVFGGTTPAAFAICTGSGNNVDFGGNQSSPNTVTGCTPQIAVSSGTLAANTCSSATTTTVTGVYTTSRIDVTYSSDPTGITGWGATGGMVIQAWPSAQDTASWKLCNQTALSITYGAISFNVGYR